MSPKLCQDDRRAIDLLLNGAASIAGEPGASGFAGGHTQERIQCAGKWLGLLEYHTVADPSASLINRTLRRVKEASGRDVTVHAHMTPGAFGCQTPLA